MRTKLGFLRHRNAVFALVAVGLVISAWGLYPRPARAQNGQAKPDTAYGSTAITLYDGASVKFAVTLPVVPTPRASAVFVLAGLTPGDTNGDGLRRVYTRSLPSPITTRPMFHSYFDITYRSNDLYNPDDDTLEIRLNGTLIDTASTPRTIFGGGYQWGGKITAYLLPAVDFNGSTTSPYGLLTEHYDVSVWAGDVNADGILRLP